MADLTVAIAGRVLAITGDQGLDAIAPAWSRHVRTDRPADATLQVETVADPADEPVWRAHALGYSRDHDGAVTVVRLDPSSVEAFVPGSPPRLVLHASPEALANGDLRAQPAHHALAAWMTGPTRQAVHAGAVAFDGRGVLFVGVGGRGKTTTALACARAGFSYLGDDLCVVEAGGAAPAQVHGVYATAKLNADSRDRLDAGQWPVLGVTSKGKLAVQCPPEIRFTSTAALAMVVALRPPQAAEQPTAPCRLTGRAALKALGATALPVATGAGTLGHWLATTAALVRQVPVFAMDIDWNFDRVVAEVHALLDRVLTAPPDPRHSRWGRGHDGLS